MLAAYHNLEMRLLEEKALGLLEDFGRETGPAKWRAFVVGILFQQEIVLACLVNVGSDFGIGSFVGLIDWDGRGGGECAHHKGQETEEAHDVW
jgi:hypothetical protein